MLAVNHWHVLKHNSAEAQCMHAYKRRGGKERDRACPWARQALRVGWLATHLQSQVPCQLNACQQLPLTHHHSTDWNIAALQGGSGLQLGNDISRGGTCGAVQDSAVQGS
jgi:hypothetical protein